MDFVLRSSASALLRSKNHAVSVARGIINALHLCGSSAVCCNISNQIGWHSKLLAGSSSPSLQFSTNSGGDTSKERAGNCPELSRRFYTINRQCNAGPIETMPCSNSAKFTAFMQDTGSVANRQRGLYPAELIRKIFTILGCPLSYFTVFYPAEGIRICINREMFRDCISKNLSSPLRRFCVSSWSDIRNLSYFQT